MLKSFLFSLTVFLLSSVQCVTAQEFSPEVREFIAVDTAWVAIQDVKVIDGTGQAAQAGLTVLIHGDKIEAIGKAGEVEIPAEAMILNGKGRTLIPGLVMMHEHLFYTNTFENWFSVDQMSFSFPRLYLAGGVTSMRTAGSIQPQSDLNIKQWIHEGKMTGPKMDVTGPFIERPGYQIAELGYIKDTEEVSSIVNYWADKGATSFKLYNFITQEDMKVCLQEAHKRGLKVTGHLCSITYEEASNLGIDNLEHGFMVSSDFWAEKGKDVCDPFEARQSLRQAAPDDARLDALINTLIANGTAITSTPVVFEPYTGHEIVPGGGERALAPQILVEVTARYASSQGKDQASAAMFDKNMQWLKQFHDQGGLLMAGTDPTGAGRTVAGYANQRTIEIFAEAGFSLPDVIKICSLNGARYLGQEDEIGTIEVGKMADLVLINGDLETDIREIRNTLLVFKNGIGFDSQKLFKSVEGQVGLN